MSRAGAHRSDRRGQGARRGQNHSRTVSMGTGSALPRRTPMAQWTAVIEQRPARLRRHRQHHLFGANLTDETESSQQGGSATSCARAGSAAHGPANRISETKRERKGNKECVLCVQGSAENRTKPATIFEVALAGNNEAFYANSPSLTWLLHASRSYVHERENAFSKRIDSAYSFPGLGTTQNRRSTHIVNSACTGAGTCHRVPCGCPPARATCVEPPQCGRGAYRRGLGRRAALPSGAAASGLTPGS